MNGAQETGIAGLTCVLSWAAAAAPPPRTTAELLAASPAADWRETDPELTLYMDLPSGRVVIELAPDFAPHHVANIKRLVRAGHFDGLAIVRTQDNYVVPWADPEEKRPLGDAET